MCGGLTRLHRELYKYTRERSPYSANVTIVCLHGGTATITKEGNSAVSRDIFIGGGGAGGHCPPLNFDKPKRSKIVYVTCGTIIRRVVAAARCKSSLIDFWRFLKYFGDVL